MLRLCSNIYYIVHTYFCGFLNFNLEKFHATKKKFTISYSKITDAEDYKRICNEGAKIA